MFLACEIALEYISMSIQILLLLKNVILCHLLPQLLLQLLRLFPQQSFLPPKPPIVTHTPAFGGRGAFITVKKTRNRFNQHDSFDSTKGYPGEGPPGSSKRSKRTKWSTKFFNGLSITTWNCRTLTFERFKYCEKLNYDILALTELWRKDEKFADDTIR